MDRLEKTLIEELREKIASDQVEFSKHAVDQIIARRISVQELREVVEGGEVFEDYPDDKYGLSCLLLGTTATGRPLHVQCSYPSRQLIKVITLYEPERWIDLRRRRRD